MNDQQPTVRRTIIGFDGTTWVVNARTASEYLFSPVFMVFFVICVILYAVLMQSTSELVLPVVVQLLMWSGFLMSSILWLLGFLLVNMFLVQRGVVAAIFTPACLLPLIFINIELSDMILMQFAPSTEVSAAERWDDVLLNTVVFVCFDLLHAHFVAPRHPAFVHSGTQDRRQPSTPAPHPTPAVAPAAQTPQPPLQAAVPATETAVAPSPSSAPVTTPSGQPDFVAPKEVKIGNSTLDMARILWIRSEDHYLSVEMQDRNVMLRGKLGQTIEALEDSLGVQINRSVWVAFSGIETLEEVGGGGLKVHMSDGAVFQVAAARLVMVRHSLNQYQAQTSDEAVT